MPLYHIIISSQLYKINRIFAVTQTIYNYLGKFSFLRQRSGETPLYFTKSFVGADGCVDGRIFTTTDFDTLRMNEVAMCNSRETYMLVDSSKFGLSSHVAYASAENIHTVITDDAVTEETLSQA